jgi:D-3-phosphoglycerate dehydrogenase
MTDAPRPRLVVERWTDPAAGDILKVSGIDIV